MKTLIILLIFLSFIQVSLIPLDLVLIVLIIRAYLLPEERNLYLAFGFGIFISFLGSGTLGVQSLIYLVVIQAIHLFKKTPFSSNYLLLLPLVTGVLTASAFLVAYSQKSSITWQNIFWEVFLSFPVYFILRLWEERFVVKKEVKLKV